jgi:hypothetical protein
MKISIQGRFRGYLGGGSATRSAEIGVIFSAWGRYSNIQRPALQSTIPIWPDRNDCGGVHRIK